MHHARTVQSNAFICTSFTGSFLDSSNRYNLQKEQNAMVFRMGT